MSNILTHNRNPLDVRICTEDIWDFHLSLPTITAAISDNTSNCIAAFVDFSDSECIWLDSMRSKYAWPDAICRGVALSNIGLTGVDNGLISYDADSITNKDFLRLFFHSELIVQEGDDKLVLNKIGGSHKIYDYAADIVTEDGLQFARLNGGFWQGFFKVEGGAYKTLPDSIGNGWTLLFKLRPMDLRNDKHILNDAYPENSGIFFYIGTRAENKWWVKYASENTGDSCDGDMSEYFGDDYLSNAQPTSKYIEQLEGTYAQSYVFANDYMEAVDDGMYASSLSYVEDGYIENDEEIKSDSTIRTVEGYDVSQANVIEMRTDNKFLLFNHAKDGFTTDTWTGEEEVILHNIRKPKKLNYFTLFHHGKNGYTTETINELVDQMTNRYDVSADLVNNAFALQINNNGSIGYKYIVKDCDNNGIKVESEFSKENVVSKGKWHDVKAEIVPENNKMMRVLLYVDNSLKLVSKLLPIMNLRKLDDLYCKQEGVPYSVSLGGGTQGLCEVAYLDYIQEPTHTLFLERNFAGSFIGDISTFTFSDCV